MDGKTGLLVGLVGGAFGGMVLASVKRAWSDVGTARAGVPKARKTAWGRTKQAVLLCFLLAIGVALALGAAARNT